MLVGLVSEIGADAYTGAGADAGAAAGASRSTNLHTDHKEVEGDNFEQILLVLAQEQQPHRLPLDIKPASGVKYVSSRSILSILGTEVLIMFCILRGTL